MRLNQSPDSAQNYYIDHVLGAGAFVGARESFKELRLPVLVYLEKAPNQDERDLIQKMLAAISVNDFLLQVESIDETILVKHDTSFAIGCAKKLDTTQPLKWVELPSLDLLLGRNATTEQVNAAKKSAWALLRGLRQELDIWGA
jgi:hypothetical protein